MKRIYLFLALLCAVSLNTIAQKTINLEALPHSIGKTATTKAPITNGYKLLYDGDGNSKYWFTWRVKNLGPDTLKSGDSLFFRTGYGSRIVYFYGPTANPTEPDSQIAIIPVAQNSTNETSVTLSPNPAVITESKTESNIQWCDSVWSKTGNVVHTDPVMTNNKSCHTVEITFWLAGVNTVTNYADGFLLFPNPAKDNLNVKFDFAAGAKNVNVVLRDLVGRTIYSHEFGNVSGELTHNINVSEIPTGMYIAELNFNDEKIVSKVAIK